MRLWEFFFIFLRYWCQNVFVRRSLIQAIFPFVVVHHRVVSFVQTYFKLHVLKKRQTCDIIILYPLSLPPFVSCKVEISCERHVSSYRLNVGLNFLLSVTSIWRVLLWYERNTSAPYCRTVEWVMAMCLRLLDYNFSGV